MKQLIKFFLPSLLLANQALAEPQFASDPKASATAAPTNVIPESTPIQTIEFAEYVPYATDAADIRDSEESDQKSDADLVPASKAVQPLAEAEPIQFADQTEDVKPEPQASHPLAVDAAPASAMAPGENARSSEAETATAEASESSKTDTLAENAAIQALPSGQQAEVVILKNPEVLGNYMLSPGDALEITVWKEEGLQQLQFLIGPDGNIIFPLIGTITVAGRTLNDLKELITFKLSDYIADPSISIKLINNEGNAVFVIGKVNKPGQVVASRRIDVLQALSLAGGLTVFADESSITVQRRIGEEVKVFPFDYSDVIDGEHLEQNILLEPGDTIAVP